MPLITKKQFTYPLYSNFPQTGSAVKNQGGAQHLWFMKRGKIQGEF